VILKLESNLIDRNIEYVLLLTIHVECIFLFFYILSNINVSNKKVSTKILGWGHVIANLTRCRYDRDILCFSNLLERYIRTKDDAYRFDRIYNLTGRDHGTWHNIWENVVFPSDNIQVFPLVLDFVRACNKSSRYTPSPFFLLIFIYIYYNIFITSVQVSKTVITRFSGSSLICFSYSDIRPS
jgi:hypothetical protein